MRRIRTRVDRGKFPHLLIKGRTPRSESLPVYEKPDQAARHIEENMNVMTFATGYDPREKSISHIMLDLFVWYARTYPTTRCSDITSLGKNELRIVEIMLQRYGAYGDDRTSLQVIGEAHGITKQYVSRITLEVLERIKADALPGNLLDHIRGAIEPHMPATVDQLEAKLRQWLGPSLSIKAGEHFAHEVLGTSIVDLAALRDPDTGDATVTAALREVILTIVRSVGAAQAHFVAGLMSERLGRWVTTNEVVAHAKSRFGFDWLNEQDGWFWYGQATDNMAGRCVLKILHVAERSVDIQEIVAGLTKWTKKAHAQNIGLFTIQPPLSIVAELVARLPLVEQMQNTRFRLAPEARMDACSNVLSESERKILGVIRKHDGVVSRHGLNEELVDTGAITRPSLDAVLQFSPIFKTIDLSFWTVVGGRLVERPMQEAIGSRKIARALQEANSYVHPATVIPPADIDGEGWHKLHMLIPKTAFIHNKWVIPRRLRVLLSSGAYDLVNHHDPIFYKGPELGKPAFHRLIGRLGPSGRTTPMRVEFRIHPEKRRIAFFVLD